MHTFTVLAEFPILHPFRSFQTELVVIYLLIYTLSFVPVLPSRLNFVICLRVLCPSFLLFLDEAELVVICSLPLSGLFYTDTLDRRSRHR